MSTERILLNERKSASQFLLEVDKGLTPLEKAKRDPDIPIYMVGVISTGNKINRNRRKYPWDYLKRECIRYMDEEVRSSRAFGELDHPEESATPELKNASHTIEDIWFKGMDVWGKIKILNAYMPPVAPGLMVRGILLNDKNIGISSRALGTLKESEGYDEVDEDLEVICWDLVSNASNYGSERLDITESRKGLLTESQCFGSHCNVKPKSIQEAKLQGLTEEEKTYLNILGVERFLATKYRQSK